MTTPSSPSRATKIGRVLYWLLESFGSLLVFYVIEHWLGLVPAIIAGIVLSVFFVGVQIVREGKVSSLTAFSGAMVLLFGALDLYFQSGFFVKLEPAIGNLAFGAFFLWTVLRGKPVIIELVLRQRPSLNERVQHYLRNLTLAWSLFFVLRASGYVWMAFTLDLDRALIIRAVVGPASFGAMFIGEFAYRYLRFGKRAFRKDEEPTPRD